MKYLLSNLILDFEGSIDADSMIAFLNKETSVEAKALKKKLKDENGVDDFLNELAEYLQYTIRKGEDKDIIAALSEQLRAYAES